MPAKSVRQGTRKMTAEEEKLLCRVHAVNMLLDNATNDLMVEAHSIIPDRERVTLILIKIAAIALNEAHALATS